MMPGFAMALRSIAAIAAVLLALVSPLLAQQNEDSRAYPSKPIHIVVAASAGGRPRMSRYARRSSVARAASGANTARRR